MAETVATSLKAQGWEQSVSTEGLEFQRRRPRLLALKANRFPARTTNSIPVRPPEIRRPPDNGGRDLKYSLAFTKPSSITVTAEPYTIGDTSPRGSRRQSAGKQRVSIPIPADGDHVEIEVASPLLRNAVTTHLGGASLSSASGWVLGLLLAMAGDKGKELITRLLGRIRRKAPKHEHDHA